MLFCLKKLEELIVEKKERELNTAYTYSDPPFHELHQIIFIEPSVLVIRN